MTHIPDPFGYEHRAYRHTRKHYDIAQNAYYIIQIDKSPPLVCAHCNNTFKQRDGKYEGSFKRGRMQYCSRACVNASMVIHHPRKCAVCDKTFKPRSEDHLACSNDCAHALLIKPPNATCEVCGEGFRIPPSRVGQRGRFCSQKCRSQAMRQTAIPSQCEWCGTDYMARNNLACFCSTACRDQSGAYRRGEWQPRKITIRAFDAFFTRPINTSPRRLTPQGLDWFFMERGLRLTTEARTG